MGNSSAIALSFIAVSLMSATTSSSFATMSQTNNGVVPERMHVSERMKDVDGWLNKSILIPLDFQQQQPPTTKIVGDDDDDNNNLIPVVTERNMMLRGDEVVQRHMGTYGSIAFVVRRPG